MESAPFHTPPKILPEQSQSLASKLCCIGVWQIGRAPGRRIVLPMTPARTASYGLGTPPPLQLWLHAVLMLFAELVSRAVSTLQMVCVRRTRECHTKAAPADLPRATTGISIKEADRAEPTGLSTGSVAHAFPAKAGIQPARSARSQQSAALSPLMSTNVGIQGRPCTLSRLAASSPRLQQIRSWIPTPHPELVEGRRTERLVRLKSA